MELNKNDVFKFGMYKGYKYGIVYAFDPGYIDWCLNNTDIFTKYDLTDLLEYGVINQDVNWQYRAASLAEEIYGINAFYSFEDMVKIIKLNKREKFFESIPVNKQTNKGLSGEYPLANFPSQISSCKPQSLTINFYRNINNETWILATLEDGHVLFFEVSELVLLHNKNYSEGKSLMFTYNGIIQENTVVEIKDDLRIGISNGRFFSD